MMTLVVLILTDLYSLNGSDGSDELIDETVKRLPLLKTNIYMLYNDFFYFLNDGRLEITKNKFQLKKERKRNNK